MAGVAMKPLTPRMEECLAALLRLERQHRFPSTPNEIGREIGFTEGGRRHGDGARGSTTGFMAPANRVNFTLLGLEQRGLIEWTDRRDGLSGRAVALTGAGAKVAHEVAPDNSKARNRATSEAVFERFMGKKVKA